MAHLHGKHGAEDGKRKDASDDGTGAQNHLLRKRHLIHARQNQRRNVLGHANHLKQHARFGQARARRSIDDDGIGRLI